MTDKQLFTIALPVEIHRKFKVACAQEGVTMRKVVAKLIEMWLRNLEDTDG